LSSSSTSKNFITIYGACIETNLHLLKEALLGSPLNVGVILIDYFGRKRVVKILFLFPTSGEEDSTIIIVCQSFLVPLTENDEYWRRLFTV
jgi:hypothetical protein